MSEYDDRPDHDSCPDGSPGEPDPRTYIFFHAGCADGFGAAWAAWKALGGGDSVVYMPVNYGYSVPRVEYGSTVYVLDFSWPAAELLALADRAKVVVLDHHRTAEACLSHLSHDNLTVVFDIERSGAVLAWEYFHPGEPVPLLLRLVEDKDLWRWKMDDSRVFSAQLRAEPFDFQTWSLIAEMIEDPDPNAKKLTTLFIMKGRAVVGHIDSIVKGLCDKAFTTRVAGHAVPCVNSQAYQSEIGDELCARRPDAPFAAIWYAPDMTSRIWSLRSRNGFDVSAVAAAFGGGGHAAAASFRAGIDAPIATAPDGYNPQPRPSPAPVEGFTVF